ncbi:MAG: protein NarK [Deltaproteobacteria bacterium RBG_13_52_11]|nr:MAG: protein NarK [Deltaproteobacteria bacterium RBG_13_52_11]
MIPFRSHIPSLLFLAGIFFLNFLSRIILAPLLPAIEGDLNIRHGEAGSFFLFISLGYFAGLLGSGFISSRFTHRRTIIISSVVIGGALLAVALSHTMGGIRGGLILMGLGAGLYLPSGIATVTSMVSSRDWGKAIAIHELAPNLSFIAAPLVAEGLMLWLPWRGVIALIGVAAVLVGVAFMRLVKRGTFAGEAPSPKTLHVLIAQPAFWIMMALFSLAIGASLGVYTILPLYLVTEQGFERSWANELVAFSRIAGPAFAFVAGWASDKMGPKRALVSVFLTTGMATVLLGIARGSWIVPFLFLQPMLAIGFFPAGFAALARIGPSQVRNVAVSFTIPVAFLVGGGVIPAGLGMMGDANSFALGIMLYGVLLLGGIILLRYLRFHEDATE